MSHVWPVTILISASITINNKLHNANLYACRIVVPWPLISPTFPRKPILTQAARPSHFSPTPPFPNFILDLHLTILVIITLHCHFFSFFLHSVISSFHPATIYRIFISSIIFRGFFIPNIPHLFASPSVHFRVLGTSARSCCRPRANHPRLPKNSTPTDQNFVATPPEISFHVSRK